MSNPNFRIAFCTQCQYILFGRDFGDMRHQDYKADAFGDVLRPCKRCGLTLVDNLGNCLLHHERKHSPMKLGESEYVPQLPEIMNRFFGHYIEEDVEAEQPEVETEDE